MPLGDLPTAVTWVECPRDAWQGLPGPLPLDRRRRHLRALMAAGVRHLDLGAFVSLRAVPRMADTEALLGGLVRPAGCDWLCIVGNARGIERAAATPGVTSVGYPLSVNETFQRRNLGRDLEQTWAELPTLLRAADDAGLSLVAYVSMGFGNPYGERWAPQDTAEAVARLRALGVTRVALADTVGRADADTVRAVLAAVRAPQALGLHLHARRDAWHELVAAGLDAGVRWFEGAFGGVGGCPFADDALVGNLPSERVLPYLRARGLEPGVDAAALDALATDAAALAAEGSRTPGG